MFLCPTKHVSGGDPLVQKVCIPLIVLALTAFSGLLSAKTDSLSFSFLNLSACNGHPEFHAFCKLRNETYGDWSQKEKKEVLKSLEHIKDKRLHFLYQTLKENEIKELQVVRITSGLELAGAQTYNDQAILYLHPAFFSKTVQLKTIPGQAHIILHELFHLYTQVKFGTDFYLNPFWKGLNLVTEWGDPKVTNSLVNKKLFSKTLKKRNQMMKSGKQKEAMALDLSLARESGFPSLYSTFNINEFFAELAAFLYHDPQLIQQISPPLVQWILKTELKNLVDTNKIPIDESLKKDSLRAPSVDNAFDFVGLLSVESKPTCTATIYRHGVLITARHCLEFLFAKSLDSQGENQHFTFLNVDFKNSVRIDGLSIYQVIFDSPQNDFAYLIYDKSITENRIELPKIKLASSANQIEGSKDLINIGFPLPKKVRQIKKLVSKPCQLDGRKGSIQSTNCGPAAEPHSET